MSINSVQTNVGAMIALQSLNKTNTDLAAAQKQISTGYRVADATDDGAAFAVAQNIRSTVSSLTTANQQLGSVQGLISTTQTGLTSVSNTMASMRDVLVKLADGNVTGDQRTQYQTRYNSLLSAVKSNIQDTSYNGATLIGNVAGSSGNFGNVVTIRNESGATYGIATFGGSALYGSLNLAGRAAVASVAATPTTWDTPAAGTAPSSGTHAAIPGSPSVAGGAPTNAAGYAALLTAGGMFTTQMNAVGGALNTIGSEANFVSGQITFNNNKVDSLNAGLGSLVDADLAKEAAQLQALQIRQQLGTQALSLANQAPQALMSLFK
jgi:flagellin